LVESILFVSDRPLEVRDVARAARIDKKRAGELLAMLVEETRFRGIRVEEIAGGFIFRTNPAYSASVRHFLQQRPVRLSRAQIETLAIVAYRQPITRPEIDDIRGVDSGPVLKGLLERDLIRIIGKKDEPGRPMLYGTTPAFLEAFSLKNLRDLPTLREYTELTDESRQTFEAETGEAAPTGPVSTADFEPDAEGRIPSEVPASEIVDTSEAPSSAPPDTLASEPPQSEDPSSEGPLSEASRFEDTPSESPPSETLMSDSPPRSDTADDEDDEVDEDEDEEDEDEDDEDEEDEDEEDEDEEDEEDEDEDDEEDEDEDEEDEDEEDEDEEDEDEDEDEEDDEEDDESGEDRR
jgi:segregation and condensation protein B